MLYCQVTGRCCENVTKQMSTVSDKTEFLNPTAVGHTETITIDLNKGLVVRVLVSFDVK